MAATREASAIVQQLENFVADAVRGHDRVALAYSGGLNSTLVAMIARKRCDLRCIVAGTKGSPDVDAGKSAKQHLDYRMEIILLDAAEVRRIERKLASECPGLNPSGRAALIPIQAVLGLAAGSLLLSGFSTPIRAPIRAALADMQVGSPLMPAPESQPIRRTALRAAALELGLPVSWANVRHRAPAAGAGIEEFIP